MSRETHKVLEMVAEGKITPEEGVRLIEALGEADRGSVTAHGRGFKFDIPDLRIPKIDLGNVGEMCVELKNKAVEGARKASSNLRRGRAGRFFEFKDYPIRAELPEGITRCNLKLEHRAGKLKLKSGDTEGALLLGKIKRVPEDPVILHEVRDGKLDFTIKQSLGRCNLRANPEVDYHLTLDNAAADSRIDLSALHVAELVIDNNAGNVVTDLGGRADRVTVDIANNAGNVQLRIPSSHAIRVKPTGSLSSDNLEKYGLEVVDGIAQSSDWDDNPKGVDIVLAQNVASFKLAWKRRDGVTTGGQTDDFNMSDDDDDDDE